jgi:hypothetical protein
MTTLNQIVTEDELPRQAELFNDDDLIIEVDMGEADPDGLADLYPSIYYQAIEADMAWVDQVISEMALC